MPGLTLRMEPPMPLETYNLGYTLYHAEFAHSAQNLYQTAERGGLAVASERSQVQAKSQQDSVQTASQTADSNAIPEHAGGGGASYGRNPSPNQEEDEKKERLPEDPSGRGHHLDISV